MLISDGNYGTNLAAPLRAPQAAQLRGQTLAIVDTGNHQLVVIDLAAGAAHRLGGLGTSAAAEGFLFPGALTFTAADRLYVADSRNRHLDEYRAVGGVWSWQGAVTPFAAIQPPVGDLVDVAAGAAGSLLVLEASGRLLSVDLATGTAAVVLADARWREPVALCCAGAKLWVADAQTHTVYEYDAAYAAVRTIGGYGATPGRLRAPRGVAVDAIANLLFVSEGVGARISTFDLAGAALEQLVLPADLPHALARASLDPTGRVLVADAAANRIQAVTAQGAAAPSLNLKRVSFGTVGVGYRVAASLGVANPGPQALVVSLVAVRGTDFSLDAAAPALPLTVAAGASGALPIRFAPTRQGVSYGEVLVATTSTASPALSALLVGEGLAADPVAVGLVLDVSGSMAQLSGTLTKIERLHQTASLMTDLLSAPGQNELSVTRFSTQSALSVARAGISAANTAAVEQTIAGLAAGGSTSIGAGLQTAIADLGPSAIAQKTLVVITDGMENTPPLIANVPIPTGTRVYTVGLGLPQFVDAAKLESLATQNGGYFQVTDGDDLLLAKFFVQVFADIVGQEVATDPTSTFQPGQAIDYPVWLTAADRELTLIVAWERARSRFDFELIAPSGRTVPSSQASWRVVRDRYLAARVPLRGSRHAAVGRWTVRVRAGALAAGTEDAVVTLLIDSDTRLRWELEGRSEKPRAADRPHEASPALGQPPFPPRGGAPLPPHGLRRSDDLIVRALPAGPDLKISRAVVEIRPPTESLAAARGRVAGIDLDHRKLAHHCEERKPSPVPPIVELARVDKAGTCALAAVRLQGPDGVYSLRMKVSGLTATKQRWQRERTFHVLVQP